MVKALFKPIDIAIFVYFRFFCGLMMAWELINTILIGKLNEYTGDFHFSYLFFTWVRPWNSELLMKAHFAVTILAAIMVAIGLKYRFAALLLFLGQTSLFLMEATEYINHHYLYCLISFWFIWLPLHAAGSVDSWVSKEEKAFLPAWMYHLLLFHMGIAYFFAGIAKINPDWLSGSPMDIYLKSRSYHPLSWFSPVIVSWGGMLYDLLVVPLLLWRRTRIFALVLSVFFHLSNIAMFGLATFPWFSLLMTSMYFDPSWPRKIPGFYRIIGHEPVSTQIHLGNRHRVLVAALSIYAFVHLMLPLRHWILYPHDPSWSEEGHMFSWRMMLREKHGSVSFLVKNKKTGSVIFNDGKKDLTNRQYKDMVGNPDFILQFAHHLNKKYEAKWKVPVAVYAHTKVSLNGRPYKEIVPSKVDLTNIPRSLGASPLVLPLKTPLGLALNQ